VVEGSKKVSSSALAAPLPAGVSPSLGEVPDRDSISPKRRRGKGPSREACQRGARNLPREARVHGGKTAIARMPRAAKVMGGQRGEVRAAARAHIPGNATRRRRAARSAA
jgi:hypothetical protein